MRLKISSKIFLFVIIFVIVAFFSIMIFFPTANVPNQISYAESIPVPSVVIQTLKNLTSTTSKTQTNLSVVEQVGIGLPIRLKIPKINVDATFEYKGLTSLGAMDVPKGPDDVAWFDLGTLPGDVGSAVVAGHYGWKDGIPAVFDDLHTLQKGDKIYVENDMKVTLTFIVKEIGTYGENSDASNVFGSSDGMAHLNLITCEGIWNSSKKSYSNRIVVFTDME